MVKMNEHKNEEGHNTSAHARLRKIKTQGLHPYNKEGGLVQIGPSQDTGSLVVVSPGVPDLNIYGWVKENRETVEKYLSQYGAILFRGFKINSAGDFEIFMRSLEGPIMTYTNRSSPRHEVHPNIYTSTDHPSDQVINMHNEHSYADEWPLKIIFYCLQPSLDAGETPIADSRKVLASLRESTVAKFMEKQVMYVRNIGTGLGMTWQEVFQTNDRNAVESYCTANGLNFCWLGEDQIKLIFTRPAVRLHPKTKEAVWFNHAFFFNILSLDPVVQMAMLEQQNQSELPFLTYYGDGSPIEKDVIEEIRDAYEEHKVIFKWMKSDVLVLDNMLTAHGRNVYQGPRKILVGMMEPQKDHS